MPPPIRSLRYLERYAHIGAPMADWRREAGDGFAAIAPLLKETDRLARRWSRPGKPAMRIVEHEGGRAVAVCDEEFDNSIELAHTDRLMWRPSELELRARFCGVLGLRASREPAAPLPGLLKVGDWAPRPAVTVCVTLAVASTADHFARLVLEVATSALKPTLVLSLTRAMWSARNDAVVARGTMVIVPLDEVLDEIGGTWQPLAAWEEYAGALLASLPANPSLSADTNADIGEQVRLLNEMQRHVIVALAEKRMIGVDARNPPGQTRLATWAGYGCDATFKGALSSLVKARLLGNGRHHGRRGGYFLTAAGKQAADFVAKS